MNTLSKLLPPEHIQVTASVANWQEAVHIASQPLIEEKLITNQYIENMITSVKENGPYMVLSDYFALMHARPGEGVNQESMSLLVTKEQVDLEGKPVKIFLILAAENSQSHLESLQNVMAIFMDDEKYQTILSGNKEAIINLFN